MLYNIERLELNHYGSYRAEKEISRKMEYTIVIEDRTTIFCVDIIDARGF